MHDLPFENLFQEHEHRIRRYLIRLAGPQYADDLTQEVFLKAYRGFPFFEGRSSVLTWLYRIAGNTAIDFLRGAAFRRNRAELSIDEREIINSLTAPASQANDIDEDMIDCVREFVEGLPDAYKAAFILHELEGFSNPEIAEILDLSLATAKIRVHRAKMRLKKKMESGCCLYHDEQGRLACSRRSEKKI